MGLEWYSAGGTVKTVWSVLSSLRPNPNVSAIGRGGTSRMLLERYDTDTGAVPGVRARPSTRVRRQYRKAGLLK